MKIKIKKEIQSKSSNFSGSRVPVVQPFADRALDHWSLGSIY